MEPSWLFVGGQDQLLMRSPRFCLNRNFGEPQSPAVFFSPGDNWFGILIQLTSMSLSGNGRGDHMIN
jgi:hypothetical protein